ncbi:MAG: winged helix DNA-binding domain-containing protein [Prevotellaceae bacterium]|jgi:hypothetical protein|nr:winged helix DNA-binding domain-containing protein [Prevotellaceae bacterium]
MIHTIRAISQQLVSTLFEKAKDIVSWMGAIQAQDYNMCKWATGIRLKSATISDMECALAKGEILRTHIMRPTWHLVADEDICWMLELCREKIKAASASRDKYLEITEKLFSRTNCLIAKMLEGNNHLTRRQIADNLNRAGIKTDTSRMIHFMYRAEAEGIVCSGADKEKQQTYALISERVKSIKTLNKDEALVKLATKYFQSHSPASLHDFNWWSGLSISDCRHAIYLIDNNLIKEKTSIASALFIHDSLDIKSTFDDYICLLPSFDEFLISYKNRDAVININDQCKAFTKNGIFHPTVMHNGKIAGTWKRTVIKDKVEIKVSLFDEKSGIDTGLLEKAKNKYLSFISLTKQ